MSYRTRNKKTRIKINNHLNKIQDDIMTTLSTTEEKERGKIIQSLFSLDGKATEISDYQRKIDKTKQHATDFQNFLFLRQLENEVSCKNQFLKTLVDTDSLKEIDLSYHVLPVIHKFITDIEKFGDVMIEQKPFDVILARRKIKQAQMFAPHVSNRSVEHINLKLYKTVNTKNYNNASVFCILPDRRMAFTYYFSSVLKVFNTDGSDDFGMWTPTN